MISIGVIMRNLIEYPLNAQDINNTLERALKRVSEERMVGTMDGVVFHQLLLFLKDPKNMDLVLNHKDNS